MKSFNTLLESIIHEFDDEIKTIVINESKPLKDIESGMDICVSYINRLRKIVGQSTFKNFKGEIHFFKTIKPKFVGQLLYYFYLQQIECNRPKGKLNLVNIYLQDKLKSFNKYTGNRPTCYYYFASGASHCDEQFFVRKNLIHRDYIHHPYTIIDSEFSTRCDYLFAEFKAHEMVIDYLAKEIDKLETLANKQEPSHVQKQEDTPFKWTGTNVALAELVIALANSGAINNGDVNVKKLCYMLCTLFNMEGINIHRLFVDIKSRDNSTSFIDKLKRAKSFSLVQGELLLASSIECR